MDVSKFINKNPRVVAGRLDSGTICIKMEFGDDELVLYFENDQLADGLIARLHDELDEVITYNKSYRG